MSVTAHSEKRWTIDDFARVSELATGNPKEPAVFAVELKQNPMTRAQLVALRDGLNDVLKDAPEKRIMSL